MRRNLIPDIFEILDDQDGKSALWLTAPALTAVIIWVTVAINHAFGEDPQITVSR
jgi:hypothetical protein